MNIKPIGERVLVKMDKVAERTAAGLIIPESAQKNTETGIVEAIGESDKIQVKVNQKIMCKQFSGTTITVDDEKKLLIDASDILAIIE